MFADKYIKKQNKEALIKTVPEADLGMCIVIPCFREPEIVKTLGSLAMCSLPTVQTEVIIILNHSKLADEKTKAFNLDTKSQIIQWIANNEKERIKYFAIGPVELQKKWAGAGVARKTGMDEAVNRFNLLGKNSGLIVSLDADTIVDTNYLIEIEKHFRQNRKHVGATIAFRHQTEGLEKKHLEGILLYENYLEYYKNALDFTGYPYSMFTIGSAFAVTAEAYVKRGGMNRRQAGEDFYFLQNLVQIGTVGEIKTTKVYPSARLSDRVPFGTGPILSKWMKGEEDLTKTYNLKSFADLKLFFDLKKKLFRVDEIQFNKIIEGLPEAVAEFIKQDNFWNELNDLNKNCSNELSFQNRFFQKFNAFKILKYLNFAHENFYKKADLQEQIYCLKTP